MYALATPISRTMASLGETLRENKVNIYMILGVASAIMALLAGLSHAYWAIWAVGIVISLALFTTAFHRVWTFIFWIGAIYILSCYAIFSYYPLGARHWAYKLLAVFSELVALFILTNLLRKTIRLRNSTADSFYTPIGIWTMVLLLFFILSNLSIFYWYEWAIGETGLRAYTAIEVILILLFAYLLWVPENFGWEKMLTAIALEDEKRPLCPACSGALKTERKTCPKCKQEKSFLWCSKCERYEVRCHACNSLTHYGEKKCIKCGEEVPSTFVCGNCGTEKPLSKWL